MEVQHYSELRKKFSKELESQDSRPPTSEKHVVFDFSDQLDIRELRNLREQKELELSRLSTPKGHEDIPSPKKASKKSKKKKRKSKKKVLYFEVLTEKPAIEIEFYQEENASEASFSSSANRFKDLKNSKHISSKHSLYSGDSVSSKKSLKEEIQDIYKAANKVLENSFKIDRSIDRESQVSSARYSKEDRYEKLSQQSAKGSKNHDKKSENFQVSEFSKDNLKEGYFKSKTVLNYYEKQSGSELLNYSRHSKQSLEDNESVHSKASSRQIGDIDSKFSSHKGQILSKIVEKPLNEYIQENIPSDIEEEKDKESLKSADFTISDQTPFQSVKYSQDTNISFLRFYENLKKGLFFTLISPIIKIINNTEAAFPKKEHKKFEDFSEHSPKGSEKGKKKTIDFDLRTSKSEPFQDLPEISYFDHNESQTISHEINLIESIQFGDISIIHPPESCPDLRFLTAEKAKIMERALENLGVCLMAINVLESFYLVKRRGDYLKSKNERKKISQANYEFSLLRKVIDEWKSDIVAERIFRSKKFSQFKDRWNFVRLYQIFEGLKFVTKAHKQWVKEVRFRLSSHKKGESFKNWVLLVRYRKVKQALRVKKLKRIICCWKNVLVFKANMYRKSCLHWYYRKIFISFRAWNSFFINHKENWVKKVRADKKYYERLYTKVFLCWKHSKALEQANFIPLRICTKTVLVKKNGNIQEKSLLDIKIIKN